jgi:hypothetical protein
VGKTFKLYDTQTLQNKIYDFVKEELNLIVSLAKKFKTNYDDAITSHLSVDMTFFDIITDACSSCMILQLAETETPSS